MVEFVFVIAGFLGIKLDRGNSEDARELFPLNEFLPLLGFAGSFVFDSEGWCTYLLSVLDVQLKYHIDSPLNASSMSSPSPSQMSGFRYRPSSWVTPEVSESLILGRSIQSSSKRFAV